MTVDIQFLTSKVKYLTIVLLLCIFSLHVNAKEKIVLGLTGTVFKDDLKNFMDWKKYLEQNNDFDVDILFSKTYEEMNRFIKEEKVDVAYVCNSSYTKLEQVGAGKLLAIPIIAGSDKYYAYIITKKESSFKSLLDFEDAIFAFTDPQSNSGSIAPKYFLLTNNLDIKTFFRSIIYTYEHGESIKAVYEGFVDGASVDSIVYTRFGEKYPKAIQDIKIIQTLGPFANSPIIVRSGISKKVFNALQKAFFNMHKDPYGKSILDKLSLDRFDAPSTQDYSNVAKMLKIIEKTQ